MVLVLAEGEEAEAWDWLTLTLVFAAVAAVVSVVDEDTVGVVDVVVAAVVLSAIAVSDLVEELHPLKARPASRRVNKIEFFIGRLSCASTDRPHVRGFASGGNGFSGEKPGWSEVCASRGAATISLAKERSRACRRTRSPSKNSRALMGECRRPPCKSPRRAVNPQIRYGENGGTDRAERTSEKESPACACARPAIWTAPQGGRNSSGVSLGSQITCPA